MTIILCSVTLDLLPGLSELIISSVKEARLLFSLLCREGRRTNRDKEFEKHQRPYV